MTIDRQRTVWQSDSIGVGPPGRVYARDLASRIAETRLVGVADPVEARGEGGRGGVRRAASTTPIRWRSSTTRRSTPSSSSARRTRTASS